ncbi:MAG: phosphoribosylanthranilate isomerase [Tatlockia sp.]|nr:phosphoribosylanthranilate isomerase [Tatlockia sp.]
MCGMTREEDIAYAAYLGVDAIGLIFAEKSSRLITLSHAEKLMSNLPPFLNVIAVLVNPSQDFVEEMLHKLPISFLQFHGNESEEFCNYFNKPYIKAVQIDSFNAVDNYVKCYQKASGLLLDTPSENHGGTGKTFNWEFIPKHVKKPLVLAGGLNAANVEAALKMCSPYAVDVCSGVESSPGVKDHKKMKEFVEAIWGKA